jgi:hypothetical protein
LKERLDSEKNSPQISLAIVPELPFLTKHPKSNLYFVQGQDYLLRLALLVGFALLAVPTAVGQQAVDVQREIWPVLRQHCLHCHGEDRAEGQLRLDRARWTYRERLTRHRPKQ